MVKTPIELHRNNCIVSGQYEQRDGVRSNPVVTPNRPNGINPSSFVPNVFSVPRVPTLIAAALVLFAWSSACCAATVAECQEMLRIGSYEECLKATAESIEVRLYGEDWPLMKAAAEFQLGKYREADSTLDAGIERYSWSVRLRVQSCEINRILGDREKSQRLLNEINQLVAGAPWRYTDADDLVALGKAAILLGADPKDVLEGFFERAMKNYKSRSDGFIAAAQLAIDKGDFALAAEIIRPAAGSFPDDPDVQFLLFEATASADAQESGAALQKTLEINPKYSPALLKAAIRQIDAEDYPGAVETLNEILKYNPAHPEAHALQAVIHHLQNRTEDEKASRQQALQFSDQYPVVDHIIGTQLSRKYRFLEGSRYQQAALKIDPDFIPAKVQLAQDLLRLGQDQSGWELADQAQKADRYDTALFNLMQLKGTLDDFETLQTDQLIVRMSKPEVRVYGKQVLTLLETAFKDVTERYGYTPSAPVIVEIFDRKEDFAVRTFGIPDVAGFLGVCFGNVITANSPLSQRGSPNNWESVLWHEFCHVITLQMTGNRIPRWLSEGISVYEERRQDSRWGQSMTPAFRDRILAGKITPVSQLSSAFLTATSGDDLNFAYYESSMVVEFLTKEHGFDALVSILQDLNDGLLINDALDRHTNGIDVLDSEFDAYLTDLAQKFAPDVVFSSPAGTTAEVAIETPADSEKPDYSAELKAAVELLREDQFQPAEEKLRHLVELFPQDNSPGGARKVLAALFRRQERATDEVEILTEHLKWSADDIDAAQRLMALHAAAENWEAVIEAGTFVLAVDPMLPKVLRDLLTAAEALKDHELSVRLLNGLLELEPADAARIHFQLASILKDSDSTAARRHVLLSLENAPRYRDAHGLLLELSSVATGVPAEKPDTEDAPAERRN